MTIQSFKFKKYLFLVLSLLSVIACKRERNRGQRASTDTVQQDTVSKPVIYNVYLENSASIDGYVSGQTSFKTALFNLLSDISLPTHNLAREMRLFYINSEVIPYTSDLKAFIAELSPGDFRKRGGSRSASDIHKVLTTALEAVNNKEEVSLFISDCVFSPSKGQNALNYLDAQGTSIKLDFSKALVANPNLTTIVLKLKSAFNGTYYAFDNTKIELSASRPYYIWIMGQDHLVQKLLAKVPLESIKGGIEHYYTFTASNSLVPRAEVLRQGQIGRFKIERDNKLAIESAEKRERAAQEGDPNFGFTVGVDFTPLGLENAIVSDSNNYKVSSSNYKLSVEAITDSDKQKDPALGRFTHKLRLRTSQLTNETLTIEIPRKMPDWIEASHTTDDRVQKGIALDQTFGLKYMIEGVSDAYKSANQNQSSLFKIQVTIKQ